MISLCAGGVQNTVKNLSKRATTLLQTSYQSEVYTQSYWPPKSQESQLWEFMGLPFGSPRTKWHLGVGPVAKHKIYYKGEVVASPKSKSWWILGIRICSWFIRAPKCSNYALTNLLFDLYMSVWVIEMLVNLPNPIPKLQLALLPPKCCELGSAPNSFSFHCLHLWTCSLVHQGAWGCVKVYLACATS